MTQYYMIQDTRSGAYRTHKRYALDTEWTSDIRKAKLFKGLAGARGAASGYTWEYPGKDEKTGTWKPRYKIPMPAWIKFVPVTMTVTVEGT